MKKQGGLAVVLGAGFSKWAADLPVAAQLFDFRVEAFGVTEEAKVRVVTKHDSHCWLKRKVGNETMGDT